MAHKNAIKAVSLIGIATTTINALTFTAVGTFTQACFSIRVQNDSQIDMEVSYDGVNSHDYLPANGTIIVEQPISYRETPRFKNNTTVYVRGTPGGGAVYANAFYLE